MADITDEALMSLDEGTNYFPTISNRLLSSFTPVRKSVGVHSTQVVKVTPTREIGIHDEEINFTVPHTSSNWLDLQNADVYIK